MKKCRLRWFNTFAFLSLFSCYLMQAQDHPICPADFNNKQQWEGDPATRERIKNELRKIKDFASQQLTNKTQADSIRIIPVVVHVLHDNGSGAIGKA